MVDIDDWVDREYSRGTRYYYEEHAKKVEAICKKTLENAGIQHVISRRVKTKESLRAKVKKMQKEQQMDWTSDKDFKRVFDIAGVRIALYLPEEPLVKDIIERECGFLMTQHDTKVYPDPESRPTINEGTKPTYRATHFIVRLNDETLQEPVEIQVMSVLGSSWAQIQHDYIYKRVNADISAAELSTLDAFGRAVILSEGLLEQLGKLRIKRQDEGFETIYDLGSFLSQWWCENNDPGVRDLGSLNVLLELLNLKKMKKGLNTRGQLIAFLTEHVKSSSVNETKKLFPNIEVRPVVIIIYCVIKEFGCDLQPQQPVPYRQEIDLRLKLNIIMSTVLWLSELFPPTYWEKQLRLGDPDDKKRVERLYWLASTRPPQLVQPSSEFKIKEDREAVDDLWKLFKDHSSPAVKLALSISNAGVLRNIKEEIGLFNRVFMALGWRLKNELDNINNNS
ncbi:hypothetical protein BDW59DRAFT_166521 [Aspergillus cavernicola]|uniref:RelA/SpoT domain-containing protein n=1 Tax=Aspergillus cavernicola TaxID=176166 RepID=A0ABR4HKQ9_9EURO